MEDIRIATDAPEKANVAYHELLHYTTNNSSGSSRFTITPRDMLDSSTDVFPSSHQTLIRNKAYQNFIADQNERLLPPRNTYYQLAWEKPEEFKEALINAGRTPAQAESRLKEALAESDYMWKIQEQRSHLQTWFSEKIKPHLKNPNDPAEIEQYFNDNPDVIKRAPSEVKQVMTELRPGSIKDYSKYFAESLSVAPFILTSNND